MDYELPEIDEIDIDLSQYDLVLGCVCNTGKSTHT